MSTKAKFWSLLIVLVASVLVASAIEVFAGPPADYRVPVNKEYTLTWTDSQGNCGIHFGDGRFMDINWGDGSADWGEPVYASGAGEVEFAGNGPGTYGLNVMLKSDGVTFRYAHLSRVYVEEDDWVSEGDLIGLLGKTGDDDYSPHLHWEGWYTQLGSNDTSFNIFDIPGVNLTTTCGGGSNDKVVGTPTLSGYNSCDEYATAFQNDPHVALFDDEDC